MRDIRIVETTSGKVQGRQDERVYVWKGIPFARPPLDVLRFRPPLSPLPWTGIRDATQFSHMAAQLPRPLAMALGAAPVPSSEDCLYLNVWSPGADNARRPVLVWIHGGGFSSGTGASPLYDGTSFAALGDIVVVTFNYRLGVLGFLHLADLGGEDYASSGNCGLLDQVAALTWVRDNIAAFGGDPSNVTVFGESAGAKSIGTLLAMPMARGLFQKAILQSGACHTAYDREDATRLASRMLTTLGLEVKDLARLHDLPLDQLLSAQAGLASYPQSTFTFRPVIDGKVLPRLPIDAVADGCAADVTILTGTNRDEAKMFTLMNPSVFENPSNAHQIEQENELALWQVFGDEATEAVVASMVDQPEVAAFYHRTDILTDRMYRISALHLAENQVKVGARIWMYRFDWPSPFLGGLLGAYHSLDLPFVWNNLDKMELPALLGDPKACQPLANRMHAAWIAFARTGNPNIPDLPHWPVYDLDRRATMLFDTECQVVHDPQSAQRRLWDGKL